MCTDGSNESTWMEKGKKREAGKHQGLVQDWSLVSPTLGGWEEGAKETANEKGKK